MEANERLAGFWRRAAAFLIDTVVVGAAGTLVLFTVYSAWTSTFGDGWEMNQSRDWLMLGTGLVLAWLYSAGFESSLEGATPGKRLMGVRVVNGGQPVGFWRASLRFVGKLVSTAILGFGFWMAGWSLSRRTLHDRMAATRVVRS